MTAHTELLKKIHLGEDSFLELKEVRFAGDKLRSPSQNDLADEMAAFANSAGGMLVLGIEDRNRAVTGIALNRLDTVEAVLRQACEQSIPPPFGSHHRTPCLARCARSGAGHYSCRGHTQPVRTPKSGGIPATSGIFKTADSS